MTTRPCSKNQRALALHAAGAVEASEARLLDLHLAACTGCRQYLEQLSAVVDDYANLAERMRPASSPEFSPRLMKALEELGAPAAPTRTAQADVMPWRRLWIPTAAAASLCLLVWAITGLRDEAKRLAAVVPLAPERAEPAVISSPNPSFIAYRRAVGESFEELDAMLARHERELLRPDDFLTEVDRRELF